MRFVALKSEAQLDVQTLHRVRDQLVGERNGADEPSPRHPLGARPCRRARAGQAGRLSDALLDTEAGSSLTPRMRALVAEVRERWQGLDRRIAALDAEFAEQARTDEKARRLTTIPASARSMRPRGCGHGDVASFARGRDLAAWLGLVPRQVTTGGKPRLVGITKRGSKYLRKTLIQGAGRQCRHSARVIRGSGSGCAGCWRGRMPIRRRCGAGSQDGAYRLGAAAPRARLRADGRGRLIRVWWRGARRAFRCLRAVMRKMA